MTNGAPPSQRRIWIDGALVPWESATVHVLSHSHQRGSLVFDYMSVYETPQGPAVFRLSDHVERFYASIELVRLPFTWERHAVRAAILETVRANPGAKAVKVSAYLASVEVDVVPVQTHVTLAIAAYDPLEDVIRPAGGDRPAERKPLKIWLEKELRNRRKDILSPQAKVAANYASPMAAKWAARELGFDEILLVDAEGYLAEGPTTNVFLVDREGRLCTPPEEGVLLGVTRKAIIELAQAEGLNVLETAMRPEALFDASEAFLTGTSAGVWPIGSVDERPIGTELPGPVSRLLAERFTKIAAGSDPEFQHWLTPAGPPRDA
ncbi:MAG: hypothetical protein HKP27_14695 [Myxococcales bacterium]|nr:hypothetical protein [Myxococcales bacterium]